MMTSPLTIKHVPFQSIYRQEYEVVEEHRGNLRLYPHTDQLPIISRAINLEFYGSLPNKLAHVDHRADGLHKVILQEAVLMFCTGVNGVRSDKLRIHPLVDENFVTRPVVVQQISETTPRGIVHRFRFFSSDHFFPDIYYSGKSIAVSDHILQRFSARVADDIADDLVIFLLLLFGSPAVSMPVGPGRALVIPYQKTLLALTYTETDTEYFFTSCLTVHQINSLVLETPVQPVNLHYGPAFTRPPFRNTCPALWAAQVYERWQRKEPLPPPEKRPTFLSDWHRLAYHIKPQVIKHGHGPGSRISFADYIPGPNILLHKPGQVDPCYEDLDACTNPNPRLLPPKSIPAC
jgi:hypothetical protein